MNENECMKLSEAGPVFLQPIDTSRKRCISTNPSAFLGNPTTTHYTASNTLCTTIIHRHFTPLAVREELIC